MRRTNLRLRKGTVRVRQGRRIVPALSSSALPRVSCGSHFRGTLLGGTGPPLPSRCSTDRRPRPLPARPARPRGLPALRQARRTGHPHPIPARVSFGWFPWGKATPEGAPEKVWASRGGTMVGWERGSADVKGCSPPPMGGAAGEPLFLPPIFLPRVREAVCFLLGPDASFPSSLFNYFFEFEWIFFGTYDRV